MIKCEVCNKEFKKIDKQHLKKHELTTEQYLELYPNAKIGYSDELRSAKSGINHPLYGQPRSNETKLKVSKGLKTMWESHELTDAQRESSKKNIQIMGAKNKGRTHTRSKEYKENLSEVLSEYYKDNPPGEMTTDRLAIQLIAVKKGGATRRVKTVQKFIDGIDWGVVTHDTSDIYSISCNTCNTITTIEEQTIRKHFFKNSLCHKCNPPLNSTSKSERELQDFIISLGFTPSLNNRQILPKNMELDIVIDSKKIAIEYNGLFWHSSRFAYPAMKHFIKTKECFDLGIQLIHIFDDEWLFKKDIVKSRLKAIFGIFDNIIYARNTKVVELQDSVARSLLNNWHLQGGEVVSSYRFGLEINNEIVAIMTFVKPRIVVSQKPEEGVFELLRFAIKPNTKVIGAPEKILNHFRKTVNPIRITSYADLRWVSQDKNIYIKLGFTEIRQSAPGYFYTNTTERFHRYGFRKPIDCPDGVSEEEYWYKKNFYKVYDCGQKLYSLECS